MNEIVLLRLLRRILTPILLTMVTIAISSCGTTKKYAMDSDQLNLQNSGVIFGRVTLQRFYGLGMYNLDGSGRAIQIKNKETGELINTCCHYFEVRLPTGTYQISYMGTPAGGVIPREEPFEFKINNGEIKYIGSIVADRDLLRHMEKFKIERPVFGKHMFAVKDYGEIEIGGIIVRKPTGKAKEPFIRFYIIDESDDVVKRFIEIYPDIQQDRIIKDFMY